MCEIVKIEMSTSTKTNSIVANCNTENTENTENIALFILLSLILNRSIPNKNP